MAPQMWGPDATNWLCLTKNKRSCPTNKNNRWIYSSHPLAHQKFLDQQIIQPPAHNSTTVNTAFCGQQRTFQIEKRKQLLQHSPSFEWYLVTPFKWQDASVISYYWQTSSMNSISYKYPSEPCHSNWSFRLNSLFCECVTRIHGFGFFPRFRTPTHAWYFGATCMIPRCFFAHLLPWVVQVINSCYHCWNYADIQAMNVLPFRTTSPSF